MNAPLRLVNAETGEHLADEQHIPYSDLYLLYKRQQHELNSWRLRYGELLRKYEQKQQQEAADSELRPTVERLMDLWRALCNHPRSRLDTKRFKLLKDNVEAYEEVGCARAIVGYAAFPYVPKGDYFTGRQAVGKAAERYDKIELIFRDAEHVEQGWALAERAEDEALGRELQ